MYRLNRQFDSRVMCMHTLDDDVMLLGTLSHILYGFSTRSRKLLWEVRLNDSVLSLCSQQEDSVKQVFAGLADGTVAVVENIQGHDPKPETFYILVGSNPVTCLCLVDRRLWCACGNRMVILNARTLDSVDSFQTSCSTMDYISLVKEGQDGIWITLRGSSILQLWDPKALTCRLLYDIHSNTFAKWTKEDPSNSSVSCFRITSLLPMDNSILVGTAEGSLVFYDIRARNTSRPPSSNGNPDLDQQLDLQIPPEAFAEDAVEAADIAFIRERNDSGCYSATTALSSSRRTSGVTPELISTGAESDPSIHPLYEDQSEGGLTIKNSSSYSATDTLVSPGETAWDDDIPRDEEVRIVEEPNFAFSEDDNVMDQEVCRSLDLDSVPVRRIWTMKERVSVDHEEDSEGAVSDWRRLSRTQNSRTYRSKLKELAKGTKRSRSVSMSDIQSRERNGRQRGFTMSMDDLQRWLHGESTGISSSVGSDSYEFDDLLIPYTEDEHGRGLPDFNMQDAEKLMQSLRRQNGFSWPALDRPQCVGSSRDMIRPPSLQIHLENDEPTLKQIDSWCSSKDTGNRSTSTNGYDDASTPGASEADPILLLGGDLVPPSGAGHHRHIGSETSSNLSAISDVSYVFDLTMQEKIKISDKPIKCLLKTKFGNEISIVSCAGSYGDDEAVLRWTQEGKEKLWTNDPILEVCPYTNTIRPSPFARSRMPRRSSLQPNLSSPLPTTTSHETTQKCSTKSSRSASVNMGHHLARVQTLFTRNPDKV